MWGGPVLAIHPVMPNERTPSRILGPSPMLVAMAALVAASCTASEPETEATRAPLEQTLLGTAGSFAVLGGSTVTNTGATVVHGNLGLAPGLAVTGFPPGLVVDGTIHAGDEVALAAQRDTTAAYVELAGLAPTADLTGQDLGGLRLEPGVYRFASSAQLTGTLTLDALGDPDAAFVFQIGSTLTTASNAEVVVIGGVAACNVFWQVGSSATLGTTTRFGGTIVALASITLTTGAVVQGRTLARTGAVTLDGNQVQRAACDTPVEPTVDARPAEADAGGAEADAGVAVDATPDAGNVPVYDGGVPDAPPDADVDVDAACAKS